MKLENTKFERISNAQLLKDTGLEINDIVLPERATSGSCGYDIHIPYDIVLKTNETIKIPTFIKCKIDDGWFLMVVPRSSLGFKYRCKLDNTIGIIDSDYYNNMSNEGHIWVKITNYGDKEVSFKKGDAFCQGIFLEYGIIDGDNANGQRVGGIGSTTK